MAENYVLRVTAGPSYDNETHHVVAVNTPEPLTLSSEIADVELNVRIQNYRGLPNHSPSTSPYFSLPPHAKNGDQYSIAFKFSPKSSISANDLVFGNDFEHPIRDRLPPGFGTALGIVKRWIDPGLDGDVYADKPYLYGPLGSSINTLRFGAMGKCEGVSEIADEVGIVVDEGATGLGTEEREGYGIPEGEAARKKWFLNEANREKVTFQEGHTYSCDFFNAYLDFNEFALRLPGFTLHVVKYWDGQALRYVLKNRKTGKLLFAVCFTLFLKTDVNEDGSIKDGVEGGKPHDLYSEKVGDKGHEKTVEAKPESETSADDVD